MLWLSIMLWSSKLPSVEDICITPHILNLCVPVSVSLLGECKLISVKAPVTIIVWWIVFQLCIPVLLTLSPSTHTHTPQRTHYRNDAKTVYVVWAACFFPHAAPE